LGLRLQGTEMTAQIPDRVIYNDAKYEIIGVKGVNLITPREFGMTPTEMSTACYRGYFVEYSCVNQQFLLSHLTVRTLDNIYPSIGNVAVQIGGQFVSGQYYGLQIPVAFTGALLIGKDFIGSMYVHMGFQKPTSFGTVVQLIMDRGRIVAETDFSEKIAAMREAMLSSATEPRGRASMDDIARWIEWTFSLDYDLDL